MKTLTNEEHEAQKKYYKNQLSKGNDFEQYVYDTLAAIGIVITKPSVTKADQIAIGENSAGVEIKRDGNMNRTGNLFIEVKEKVIKRTATGVIDSWVDSGIYRNDNSWLYVIGDEDRIFIFSKKMLQRLDNWYYDNPVLGKPYRVKKYQHVDIKMYTSIGYLLPITDAEKYCDTIIYPKDIIKNENKL